MSIFTALADKVKETAVQAIAGTIDNITTTDDEKLKAKNDLARILTESLDSTIAAQATVLTTEMQGNWLQRSWRPLSALSFTFIIVYRYFLSPVFHFPSIDMPSQFWDLMYLCLGGYTAMRSVEKISDSFTKNVDMTFLRKKDRKQPDVDN